MIRIGPGQFGGVSPALVGLGSPHGDDQVGWVAIDRLRPRLPPDIVAIKAAGGLELLDSLVGQDHLIVVDAAAPAGRPGVIRSFEWPISKLPSHASWCTHGFGLFEALCMAESLGRLPHRVSIETVEALATSPNSPLSDAAERGLDELIASLLARLVPPESITTGEPRCTKPP